MKVSLFVSVVLVLFFIFIPSLSLAADPPSIFSGINIWQNAYCGSTSSPITSTEGPKGPCGFCDAIIIASNVMRYMFELVFYILFPVFFAWGGIQFMISQGNPSKIKQARQILISTVIGFVIAAAAWLIIGLLFHLMTNLSSTSSPDPNSVNSINPWNKIEC
ncbi:MAG: pilin [Candidatus Paceibacterota bacterium]|jgi:hypothetical protein